MTEAKEKVMLQAWEVDAKGNPDLSQPRPLLINASVVDKISKALKGKPRGKKA